MILFLGKEKREQEKYEILARAESYEELIKKIEDLKREGAFASPAGRAYTTVDEKYFKDGIVDTEGYKDIPYWFETKVVELILGIAVLG